MLLVLSPTVPGSLTTMLTVSAVFSIPSWSMTLYGFGQFCLVILALSTISNNIPNLYSLALSTQTLWDKLIIVPRFIWTFVGAAVSLAIAIPAYYDFANVMSDLMDLIGYWLAAYSAVGISEHYFSSVDSRATMLMITKTTKFTLPELLQA